MAKNAGNNGATRVQYIKETNWAKSTGRYLKTGILIPNGCYRDEGFPDEPSTLYATVRFDDETMDTSVDVACLYLA